MFWQRSMNDRTLRKRLLEVAGDPAFAQSPERQLKLAENSVRLVLEAVALGQLLALLSERMTMEERSRMLVEWWTSCDGYIYLHRKEVLEWLHESGYIGSLERPAEPVTIYRGASSSAHKLGLSWSLDADVARHFAASSLTGTGRLYAAVAPPRAFVAGFEGLGPPAYVVDPRLLTSVSEVGKVRWLPSKA
jgi:hypothetical protein